MWLGVPVPADRIAAQVSYVTPIRNLTHCSYALLIVDTRNITAGHRGGNASRAGRGSLRSLDQNLLTIGSELASCAVTLVFARAGSAARPFASITS